MTNTDTGTTPTTTPATGTKEERLAEKARREEERTARLLDRENRLKEREARLKEREARQAAKDKGKAKGGTTAGPNTVLLMTLIANRVLEEAVAVLADEEYDDVVKQQVEVFARLFAAATDQDFEEDPIA